MDILNLRKIIELYDFLDTTQSTLNKSFLTPDTITDPAILEQVKTLDSSITAFKTSLDKGVKQ